MPSGEPPRRSPIRIEPLSRDHAGAAFSCGVRRIDQYLGDGPALQQANLARLFVAVERGGGGAVLGYYALHNHHIEAECIPPPLGPELRRGSLVGAVHIVMLAVDRRHQRRGIGTVLLMDALRRSKRVAVESGVWAVILDALDERAEAFYRRFGFDTLAGGTRRLFLPVARIG